MVKKKITSDGKYKLGEDIYIPSGEYDGRSWGSFYGGLCEIIEIKEGGWELIKVRENSNTEYGYESLVEKQKELKKEYGKRRGRYVSNYCEQLGCPHIKLK